MTLDKLTQKTMHQEMQGAYIQACDSYSHDITKLYLTLEQIFEKYRKAGIVQEGEEFLFDMGLGVTLCLKFYDNATEIYADNYKSTHVKENLILSKEQSAAKEYGFLKEWGRLMSLQGLAIGKTVPDEFMLALQKIKPGMVVSFTEGKSYVCKRNNKGSIEFAQVFDGDLKNLQIENFTQRESFSLSLFDRGEMQRFYQQNKKVLTQTAETDYALLDKSYQQLKEIERDISRLHSKKVTIGPMSFIAKKSLFNTDVLWYGENGSKIEKEQLAYLLGVLNTQPIQTKYVRKEPTYQKTAEDAEFKLSIEHLLDGHHFEEAFQEMLFYSLKNKQDLTIKTDGFLRNEENQYIAGTIVFKDGKAYKVTYENNDFSEEAAKFIKLTGTEFKTLCEQKYTDSYKRHFAYTVEGIRTIYQTKNEQVLKNQEAVANQITTKDMKEKNGIVFSANDISLGESEYKDILENLSDKPIIEQFLRR